MTNAVNQREQRGLVIAATCKIVRKGGAWLVPSQSTERKQYVVCLHDTDPVCTCPDCSENGNVCKHIVAARLVYQRTLFDDGSVEETRTVTVTETVRKSYGQDWKSYNRAQTTEKSTFQSLLHELCQRIPEPEMTGPGRPRFPLRDAIFAAAFKVYSTVSTRRFISDLNDAHAKGFITRVPSFNVIIRTLEHPDTFEVLRSMVIAAAVPLKALESNFACDSTGFSGSRFDKWYDHKFGQRRIKRAWVKVHAMVGTRTNCVTAVEIHDREAHDGTQLPALLNTTKANFTVSEVSADLAYSSRNNLQTIADAGASAFIPFKRNATDTAGGLWAKAFHYFCLHREEFDRRYHQRSNIETAFHMIKAKFGDSVRSKTDMAMRNEVLAKLLCHNVVCVIQSMHEFGIDPTFASATAGRGYNLGSAGRFVDQISI